MTTHVVCLDGTGQTRTQANPTNISLIFNAIGGAIVDAENNSFESTLIYNGVSVQVGKYLAGVGTGSIGLFDLIQQVDGEGIAEPIVRGYTFLSRNYEPGDDIITVGFSRGAAAARCLAGFVLGQGLLNPANYHPENKTSAYLRGVAAWYKYRQGQPNLAKYENLTNVFLELGEIVPDLTDTDFVPVERILAVGVFDTVSSMGLASRRHAGCHSGAGPAERPSIAAPCAARSNAPAASSWTLRTGPRAIAASWTPPIKSSRRWSSRGMSTHPAAAWRWQGPSAGCCTGFSLLAETRHQTARRTPQPGLLAAEAAALCPAADAVETVTGRAVAMAARALGDQAQAWPDGPAGTAAPEDEPRSAAALVAEATWPRSLELERMRGSIAGGLVAALLVLIAPTPLVLLPAIFPIATATIALRRVNYKLFVVAVTCLFVLVAELLLPATGIPVARAINSVIGSVVGAAAALLLWPDRGANGPAAQLAEAVAANLALAAQAIAAESAAPFDAARRAAGVASTAAEITCRRLALAGQSRRVHLRQAASLLAALRTLAGAALAQALAGRTPDPARASVIAERASCLAATLRNPAAAPSLPMPPHSQMTRSCSKPDLLTSVRAAFVGMQSGAALDMLIDNGLNGFLIHPLDWHRDLRRHAPA